MIVNELIQGVIVRVAIVMPVVVVVTAMMAVDADVIYLNGIPIPYLSLLAVGAILYGIAELGLDHPAFLWCLLLALLAVALLRLDETSMPYTGIQIRWMAMLGIVALQQPFAVMVLAVYQRMAKQTNRRIEIEMDALSRTEMERMEAMGRQDQ